LKKYLGKDINEVFTKFYEKPIASASIAQVHKAILKNDDLVAVKVRRPGITNIIKRDFEIMVFIAKLLEKHIKPLQKYKPVKIVEEFKDWTKKELNFTIEMENMLLFYENFKHHKTTKIPKVYPEYCNEKLIVMEYIDGIELHNISNKYDVKKVMLNGINSILEQVFIHGLFHADPHSSNILVMKDNKICFVDFGIVGRFDENLKSKAIDLFVGVIEGNTDAVVETLLDLGIADQDIDMERFKERITDAILPLRGTSLKQVKISRVLEEVLDIALDFRIRIPREFVLFGKAIVTIEGIGLLYYPEFEFSEVVQPFVEEVMVQRYTPNRLFKDSIRKLLGYKKIAEKLPGQATRVLDKLEKGKIRIEMKDTDIEKLSIELDKSSNRLTYGMIIAALLISGSLVINVGDKLMYGLPIISLLCFSAAGIMGLMLFVSIYKERRN